MCLSRSVLTHAALRMLAGPTFVSASSATNAWAVGFTESSGALVLHWNGHSWKQVTIPDSGPFSSLSGVSIGPSGRAWAVGSTGTATLILHWNGHAWH
jgi:hypothetical protein